MAKNDNLKDFLTDIADAIREKKGTEDKINPQNFSTEIASIETDSPFAVDFGEEIATMDPYTLASLREDIDYYNEVQRKRASGEVTDDELIRDVDFRKRIAWWPKGMKFIKDINGSYTMISLKYMSDIVATGYSANLFVRAVSLSRIDNFDLTGATALNSAFAYTGLIEVNFSLDSATDVSSMFTNCYKLRKAKLHCPLCTNFGNLFIFCYYLDEVEINIDKGTNLTNMFTYCYYLKTAKVSGMASSLYLGSCSSLLPYSVHYILENAIGSTSEPITLTLHATAKTNWEASEYYEEDLVIASSKNITIA